jgi:hypothetical protein
MDSTTLKSLAEEIENTKLKELLQKEYENDKNNFPTDRMILIIFSFVTLVVISLLKGSSHTESIIHIKA